jgi:ferredoxin
VRLVLDPVACDGRGLCAELLPEVVELDDWGFPIVPDVALDARLEDDAEEAVRLCPRLALRLVR